MISFGSILSGIQDPISFTKIISPDSRHDSDHAPIAGVTPFSLPFDRLHHQLYSVIQSEIDQSCTGLESSFLYELIRRRKCKFVYGSENEIQENVKHFLTNILRLMGVDCEVTIVPNVSIAKGSADIYIVRSINGLPILVCEVKCPIEVEGKDVLEHPRALGQLFDYMTELRHMFGQQEVFGVLTNLKNWRICCFADTVAHASDSNFSVSSTSAQTESSIPTDRSLCASRLIPINDSQLGCWLVLYLKKAMNATFRPVALLSKNRGFLHYNSKTYQWKTLSIASVSLILPRPHTKGFSILRYFHGGADGKVALSITDSGHLAVLKVHHLESDASKEINLWKDLYAVNCFQVKLMESISAMVMPVVFHVTKTSHGTPQFNFNITEWSKDEVATAEVCPLLDSWTQRFNELWANFGKNVDEVAFDAIESFAQSGYLHRDVKWNHVAVLPKFDQNGDLIGLSPILIDLASVEKCENQDEAISNMLQQLADDSA